MRGWSSGLGLSFPNLRQEFNSPTPLDLLIRTIMDFKDLVGRTFDYYGSDNHTFKLDNMVWEAVEDENDGYRSMLEDIKFISKPTRLIFYNNSFARVMVEYDEESNYSFYHLRDVDSGHIWLTFGTDNSDDYYPYFTFICSVDKMWDSFGK